MDIRYMNADEVFTTEQKLDHCLKHLKDKENFDYSFLTSMKKYVEAGYFSQAQRESIEKIWTRWNVSMYERENEQLKAKQDKLEKGYNKMMDILESCPTHKEETIKMDVDEKDEVIQRLENKVKHLEALLKIYMV